MDKISVTLPPPYKEKPAGPDIPFGVFTTDHMFLMNYDREQGWHDPRIVPYAPFQMDPACMVLHYAQEIFEGMKAYRDEEGRIRLFRIRLLCQFCRALQNSCHLRFFLSSVFRSLVFREGRPFFRAVLPGRHIFKEAFPGDAEKIGSVRFRGGWPAGPGEREPARQSAFAGERLRMKP